MTPAAPEKPLPLSACSCIGRVGADPYCPCEMRLHGLEPTELWTLERKAALDAALGEMFGWSPDQPANQEEGK